MVVITGYSRKWKWGQWWDFGRAELKRESREKNEMAEKWRQKDDLMG